MNDRILREAEAIKESIDRTLPPELRDRLASAGLALRRMSW